MKIACLVRGVTRSITALAITLGLPLSLCAAGGADELTIDHPKVKEVIAVQEVFTKDLMAQPEILGTAVGQDDDGEATLLIFVNNEAKNHGEVMRALPPTLKGKRVRPELTDRFRAFAKGNPPTASVSHTAKQTPPIQLGTSGGWGFDLANGFCCGGTLGSLIQVTKTDGTQPKKYILSNYHVFESDIVTGGNSTVATTGNPIIQPGLIDVNCNKANAQEVATLVTLSALPNNNVDCSVAQIIPGMVSPDGAILEIGPLSPGIASAFIGQAVKKSGRTTGLTRSMVAGLNATISVAYENECAGGSAFTRTFTGQIVINNKGSRFLAGGDSGSLMVQDVGTNPKAVGLLYAGSSFTAIANPIGEVLNFIGPQLGGTATMVGK